MIVSVSRRTDIPAFYSEWFFNRLRAGLFYSLNPFNPNLIRKIKVEEIDCFVFWTKNPGPMLNRINELERFPFYFHFTLTPYDEDIEPFLPSKYNVLIPTFKELSKRIGKERVIWRYDPIILTKKYDLSFHKKAFEEMVQQLHNYTIKCIISFVDLYKNTLKNSKSIGIIPFTPDVMKEVAAEFSKIANRYNLIIETCSERIDFFEYGIGKSKCIDNDLITKITGKTLSYHKDSNQRRKCLCFPSIDIGVYNTCKHHCKYCYANYSESLISRNLKRIDESNELLVSKLPVKKENS